MLTKIFLKSQNIIILTFLRFPITLTFAWLVTWLAIFKPDFDSALSNYLEFHISGEVFFMSITFAGIAALVIYLLFETISTNKILKHITAIIIATIGFLIFIYADFLGIYRPAIFLSVFIIAICSPFLRNSNDHEICQVLIHYILRVTIILIIAMLLIILVTIYRQRIYSRLLELHIDVVTWFILVITSIVLLSSIPKDFKGNWLLNNKHQKINSIFTVIISYIILPIFIFFSTLVYYNFYILYNGINYIESFRQNNSYEFILEFLIPLYIIGTISLRIILNLWQDNKSILIQLLIRFWWIFLILPTTITWDYHINIGIFKQFSDDNLFWTILTYITTSIIIYGMILIGKLHIRWLLLTVAITLLLSSFGPWGIRSITISYHKNTLLELLEENKILQNGYIISDKIPIINISNKDRKKFHENITSIDAQKAIYQISPLFSKLPDNPFPIPKCISLYDGFKTVEASSYYNQIILDFLFKRIRPTPAPYEETCY